MATVTTPPRTPELPPIERDDWFHLDGEDPVEIVLSFCDNLPRHLEFLFRNDSFALLINSEAGRLAINSEIFYRAFEEAVTVLRNDLGEIRYRLERELGYRNEFLKQLSRIGFTGNALRLKAVLMNSLADSVQVTVKKRSGGIINFVKKPLVRVVRKALAFLNNLLGSLKIVIPGLESIKEIKEVGEHYLGIADEG